MQQNTPPSNLDVIVVGGGHAGIEASLAAARMGCMTGLITMSSQAIGRMSCNPAIGGSAKGHLVREIDALGGEMGKIADATGIHFRMLNRSKGPAVWSPRCQNDRDWYSAEASKRIFAQNNLLVIEDSVDEIITQNGRIDGVKTQNGSIIRCYSLVICSGTFLRSLMHTGDNSTPGGRFGEPTSGLSIELSKLGLKLGRLKTGTPPRILRNSIDFGLTEPQYPEEDPQPFSFSTSRIENHQIPMFLTYTNGTTHEILKTGFDRSPMFTGRIKATGPRYCPSVEDKVNRFGDKERHQIFLEPEGYESDLVYVNGFSTSLPQDIQDRAIRTIPGLKNCKIARFGYAVEYDFVPPHQLKPTLETKKIDGLFHAGQINGTSGYEEAAAQGLVAGINAANRAKGVEQFTLSRSESYVGVMIDDLINKGTDEPYRIFTSRAEYRLLLRQDNADSRLMRKGHSLALISKESIERLNAKEKAIETLTKQLLNRWISPSVINPILGESGSQPVTETVNLAQVLKRPEISLSQLLGLLELENAPAKDVIERVEIETKYEGYLSRQLADIATFEKQEAKTIPDDFNYSQVRSLSSEGREKLNIIRPRSIGQASRISGVTPADVTVLLIALRN